MFIEDVVRKYPEAVRPLAEAGLVYVACGESLWGTLADLAREKGLHDIDSILGNINRHLGVKSEELK